jgi:RNA polymerase sigma factor (TIGR02999 family)
MSEVTQLLEAVGRGDEQATVKLLPLVYEELRRIARSQMVQERANHTLQATALVHEAYLRLLGDAEPRWDDRRHFFAAAAEAMRRILIDHARTKNAAKRGGQHERVDLNECPEIATPAGNDVDLLALDEALTKLETTEPDKAQLVKLRYFAGLSVEEAAEAMDISPATAKRHWAFARAWLYNELNPGE